MGYQEVRIPKQCRQRGRKNLLRVFSGANPRPPDKPRPAGRGARLAWVPLPGQALIGLEWVTVLVEVLVKADRGVLEGLLGGPSGWMQPRRFMGFADVR